MSQFFLEVESIQEDRQAISLALHPREHELSLRRMAMDPRKGNLLGLVADVPGTIGNVGGVLISVLTKECG